MDGSKYRRRVHGYLCRSVLLICTVASSTVIASTADTPEARAYIEKYRMAFPFDHEKEAVALYDRILSATAHDDRKLRIERDIKYGPDERNRLDIHVLKSDLPARPILMYFHGGGFVSGDTRIGSNIYDNVANYFARQGLLAINVTYRLAPQSRWPSGIEDVDSAVQWVRAHAADFDGDSSRIFLMGHSAGAAHVAGYIFGNDGHATGIRGAILLSGRYSVPKTGPDDVYYGADTSLRERQSPMSLVHAATPIPTLVGFAEYDPYEAQREAVGLAEALCRRDNKCPSIVEVLGHNHLTEVFHFDTADDSGARDIVDFVRRQLSMAR